MADEIKAERTPVDWDGLTKRKAMNYFNPQVNVTYRIGIKEYWQVAKPFAKKNKEGVIILDDKGQQIMEMVPGVAFKLDSLDGQPCDLTYEVTSKKLLDILKTFHANKMIVTHYLQLKRTGSGFSTTYECFPIAPKA